MNPLLRMLAAAAGAALTLPSLAQDVSLSGFGTLGYAQSNRSWTYQRFVDDGGTLQRDTRLGVQIDARLAPEWSATVQASLAPSISSDRQWDVSLPWAFLSWRPSNDLLLRAGKLRLPLLLYSESLDVGTTFEFARLPTEVYSLSPTSDVIGLAISKSWLGETRDVDVEAYVGRAKSSWRIYTRDAVPGLRAQGAGFEDIDLLLAGVLMTVREGDNRYRLSAHRVDVQRKGGPMDVTYPYVPIGGGLGYYQVSNMQPGPGVPTEEGVLNYTFTAGVELALPRNFTLVGEAMRRKVTRMTTGTDSWAAYTALLKRIGPWTPYIYASCIRSSGDSRALSTALNGNTLPDFVPNAAMLNAGQRAAADGLTVFEQSSWAIGTSYTLAPGQKLKAEWLRSRTGSASAFVDAPAGESSGHRTIDVLSFSYNFTF